jgi:hypothetical protein
MRVVHAWVLIICTVMFEAHSVYPATAAAEKSEEKAMAKQ